MHEVSESGRESSNSNLRLIERRQVIIFHDYFCNKLFSSFALYRMPDIDEEDRTKIPVEKLPRCGSCGGLLRPHVVWFGESLDEDVLKKVYDELGSCDLCLVVGTSSVVYPAAMFAPHVAARSVSVAEFNMELTGGTDASNYLFLGPAGTTLPEALAPLLKS